MIGAMIPCQNPTKNPAGLVLGSLYLEFGPAIRRMLCDDFFVFIYMYPNKLYQKMQWGVYKSLNASTSAVEKRPTPKTMSQ